MEMKNTDKITRTITVRTIYYAYLTDELEVKKACAIAFGTNPANIPNGAKIIDTSTKTLKCSMSIEKFFKNCEAEEIEGKS